MHDSTEQREYQYQLKYDKRCLAPGDGMILGNGDLSVSVYETRDRIIWRFGKGDVWDRRHDTRDDPSPVPTSAELARLIEEGWKGHVDDVHPPEGKKVDPAFAERVREIFAHAKSYDERPYPNPKPLGELALCLPSNCPDFEIEQRLLVEEGRLELKLLLRLGWKLFVESFVTPNENVLVVKWRTEGLEEPESLHGPLRFKLYRWPDPNYKEFAVRWTNEYDEGWLERLSGHDDVPLPAPEVREDHGLPYIEQLFYPDPLFQDGFRACMAICASGEAKPQAVPQTHADRWARIHLTPSQQQEGWVAVGVATSSDKAGVTRTIRDLSHRVNSASDKLISDWRSQSRKAAQDFWSKSRIELEDKFLEKLWFANLHVLRCIYKAGTVTPGIFIPCTISDYSYWHGDYHMNYNFQQPFWGVIAANHPELMEAYMDGCDFMVPIGRKIAKEAYGARGIFIQLSNFPIHALSDPYPTIPYGRMSFMTAWTMQGHWWHYLYTGDTDLLRRRGYPFIRECALFYLDFLTLGEDGFYYSYPSNYAEQGLTGKKEDRIDCSQELAHVRFLLWAAIEASRILDVDEELRAGWQERLEKLAPYPEKPVSEILLPGAALPRAGSNKDRTGASTATGFYGGGYALAFPAEQVHYGSSSEFREKVANTAAPEQIQGCIDHGSYRKWFWTQPAKLIWFSLIELRLGRFDDFDGFRAVCERWVHPNGIVDTFPTKVFGHGPSGLQTESLAINAPIQEMLMQSWDGLIRVFPFWPSDKSASFRNLRARGGFLISAAKTGSGGIEHIRIFSELGGTCKISAPWTKALLKKVADASGPVAEKAVPVAPAGPHGIIHFDTVAGETWELCQSLE